MCEPQTCPKERPAAQSTRETLRIANHAKEYRMEYSTSQHHERFGSREIPTSSCPTKLCKLLYHKQARHDALNSPTRHAPVWLVECAHVFTAWLRPLQQQPEWLHPSAPLGSRRKGQVRCSAPLRADTQKNCPNVGVEKGFYFLIIAPQHLLRHVEC